MMMRPLTFPSRQFELFSRSKGISTEHSNLRQWLHIGDWPQHFYIESTPTGAKKLFLFEEAHRDNEDEITHVTYIHPGDARVPRVTIWND
jgi:hypothetical protein